MPLCSGSLVHWLAVLFVWMCCCLSGLLFLFLFVLEVDKMYVFAVALMKKRFVALVLAYCILWIKPFFLVFKANMYFFCDLTLALKHYIIHSILNTFYHFNLTLNKQLEMLQYLNNLKQFVCLKLVITFVMNK